MSSPYWSGPAPGEDRPSWEQPPSAEPTVPLQAQPHRPGWPAAPEPWSRSAATAPFTPYEPDGPSHQALEPYQPDPGQGYPASTYRPQGYRPGGPPVSAYPVQYPAAMPYPVYPVAGQPVLWSDRSKAAAAVLAFFLGPLGVHHFYLGNVGRGVVQLVLSLTVVGLAVTWIWVVVDFVLILTGGLRDRYGRPLR